MFLGAVEAAFARPHVRPPRLPLEQAALARRPPYPEKEREAKGRGAAGAGGQRRWCGSARPGGGRDHFHY